MDGFYTPDEYLHWIEEEEKAHASGQNFLWPAPRNSRSWQMAQLQMDASIEQPSYPLLPPHPASALRHNGWSVCGDCGVLGGEMSKPVAIDLFCGLGGWTDGLLLEGYDVTGYDIEEHAYGDMRYQGNLVLADVCTLHGAQFKDATLIVASPPCQEYSYMAMPWSLAKAKAAAIRADETGEALAKLNRLFNECFRIQKEASFAAGRHIPMVVENVRGAQPWVGRAQFNFGSFYLWGDVPALMPIPIQAVKVPGFRFDGSGKSFQTASVEAGGIKQGGDWFNSDQPSMSRLYGSKSPQRKMASAMIAMIPLTLSRHIGATYHP